MEDTRATRTQRFGHHQIIVSPLLLYEMLIEQKKGAHEPPSISCPKRARETTTDNQTGATVIKVVDPGYHSVVCLVMK